MTALRPKDVFLAVLVVFVFGVSFVAVKLALQSMPPFALCAWRFFLAAFPLVLLLPRPKAPVPVLIGYGFCIGALQFAPRVLRDRARHAGRPHVADHPGPGDVWRNGLRVRPVGATSVDAPRRPDRTVRAADPRVRDGSTALAFGERLTPWQTVGVVLVIGGLALVVFGPRVKRGFLRSRRWPWQRRSTT